jgi:hypothetical protein
MSTTGTEAPPVSSLRELSRDELRDRLLDAAFTATGLFARGKREVRRCPIPEQPLRVLTALLILIEQASDAAVDADKGLLDQHCITTRELLALLPPRKARGTAFKGARVAAAPAMHPDALFMALDWLAAGDFITLKEVGQRRRAHVVRLTLDHTAAAEPRWEHARQVSLDGVLLKRLTPALLAILGHLAYAADERGAGSFTAGQVESLTGLSFKWVNKQLTLCELGPGHGLQSWEVHRQDGERVLAVQLCKPDDTEVMGTPRSQLHQSFYDGAAVASGSGAPVPDAPVADGEAAVSEPDAPVAAADVDAPVADAPMNPERDVLDIPFEDPMEEPPALDRVPLSTVAAHDYVLESAGEKAAPGVVGPVPPARSVPPVAPVAVPVIEEEEDEQEGIFNIGLEPEEPESARVAVASACPVSAVPASTQVAPVLGAESGGFRAAGVRGYSAAELAAAAAADLSLPAPKAPPGPRLGPTAAERADAAAKLSAPRREVAKAAR